MQQLNSIQSLDCLFAFSYILCNCFTKQDKLLYPQRCNVFVMIVYIEYVLLDNFVIDSLLLCATHLTLRQKIRWWRIALSALFGSASAIAITFVNGIWAYLVKLACLVVMTLIANGKKLLIRYCLIFSAYTALLGGLLIALFYLLQGSIDVGAVITYFNGVPLSLYVLAVVLLCVVAYLVVNYIRQSKRIDAYTARVTVSWADKQYDNVTAYLDSGNSLRQEGLPVCFVMPPLDKRLKGSITDAVLTRRATTIRYTTMAGEVQTVAIRGTISYRGNDFEVLLALSRSKRSAPYTILLNNSFLEVQDETTTATKTDT